MSPIDPILDDMLDDQVPSFIDDFPGGEMSVTDTQLWWLLRRDLEAARSVLDELYGRGFDIGDVLNPLREAQAAVRLDSQEEREPDHGDEPHEFYADLADSQKEGTP